MDAGLDSLSMVRWSFGHLETPTVSTLLYNHPWHVEVKMVCMASLSFLIEVVYCWVKFEAARCSSEMHCSSSSDFRFAVHVLPEQSLWRVIKDT